MKRKIGVGIILIGGGIFLSTKAFAQASPVVVETGSVVDPNFFVAILAGVIMALGFQMVLTNLSVAAGISAVGDIHKKANGSKSENTKADKKRRSDPENKSNTPLGVKILSGAGIWAMITGVLSLFFASFFAVKLSLIPANGVGVALGLTIWASFMFIMFYLESKGIGSLINGVFSTAIGAVKSIFSGAGSLITGTASLFQKNESAKIESIAAHTVDKISHEIKDAIDHSDITTKIEEYINKLAPQPINLQHLKDELSDLLKDIKIQQRNGNLPGEKELIMNVAEKETKFSKEDVSAIDKLIDIGKSTLKVAGTLAGAGGIAAAVTAYLQHQHNSMDVEQVKHEVEDFIEKKGEPEVEPDLVRAELDEIFNNESKEKIKAHHIDKEYVAAIVAERKGVSRERALKAADSVEQALNTILKESNISEIVSSKIDHAKDEVMHSVNSKKEEILSDIENRIRNFFNKINRPELDYNLLRSELELMIQNPKESPEILKRKLKQFDRNTLAAILSANSKFSKQDVDKIVHKFDEAKSNVITKIESTETQLRTTLDQAKDFALIQAENTRKTTAAASWWLLATLVLTGVASVLGGMAAL